MTGLAGIETAAEMIADANLNGKRIAALPAVATPPDVPTAYVVQSLVIDRIGAIGGWKAGAKGPDVEPIAAPLPATGLIAGPASLPGAAFGVRVIEVEVAFRFGRDLPPRDEPYTREEVMDAFASVMPAIELVDSRFEGFPDVPWPNQLADLHNHARLILGPERTDWRSFDLSHIAAKLTVDGAVKAETVNGNLAVDIIRPVVWLLNGGPAKRRGVKAGQVVTTGTLTGMEYVGPAAKVAGEVAGLGRVELSFS